MLRISPSIAGALVVLLSVTACQIENRPPSDSQQDDEAIRAVVSSYYQARSAADAPAVRDLFWDSALVQMRIPGGGGWRVFTVRAAFTDELSVQGAEPVRIELRQKEGIAGVWVDTREKGSGERGIEATDHFVLRQVGDAWRIASLVSAGGRRPRGSSAEAR